MKILRKTASLILALSLLLGVMNFPASAATEELVGDPITVTLANGAGTAGGEFTVKLTVAGTSNLGSFGVEIYYDSTILTCSKADVSNTACTAWSSATKDANPDDTQNQKDEAYKDAKWKMATTSYAVSDDNGLVGNGDIGAFTFTVANDVESGTTSLHLRINDASCADDPTKTRKTEVKDSTVSITGVTPTLASVSLPDGKDSVQVDGSTAVEAIQATATSTKGSEQTANVAWSVSPADGGVSIASDGKITVAPKAKGGTYKIVATPVSGKTLGTAKEAELTVTRTTAVATSIELYKNGSKITGATDTAVIPPTETSPDNTYTYSAKVLDQFGDEMTGQLVTWAADPAPSTNPAFDTSTGELTVKYSAAALSNLKIKATCSAISDTTAQAQEITVSFVAMAVNWDSVVAKDAITYGDTNAQAFTTLPATGTATVGSTNLTGTFKVVDPDVKQAVPAGDGEKATVTVEFEVTTEGTYNGTKITKSYEVTVNKKSITGTMATKTIGYGDAVPTTDYEVTFPTGALVGSDDVAGLGLTFTTNASTNPGVGSYNVTTSSSSTNYTVTVDGSGKLVVAAANITGFTETNPAAVTILANNEKNTTEKIKEVVSLPATVTVEYGDSKTEANIPMTWTMDPTAVTPKGGTYTFTGVPTLGTNFTNSQNLKLTTTVTVTPVTGTASITSTEATKAFAAVMAASQWSDLGMPAQVTVSYDNSVTDGSYSITDWTPDLAGLKQQATGTADKSVSMKPTVTYPDWATISNADTLAFTMNLTPKYPVTVALGSVSDTTYGTYVTVPEATQTAIDNGTDATATFKYYYEGVAPTVYARSEAKPTEVGTYKVTAELVSDTHSGKASQQFSITAKALADGNVALTDPDATYTYDKTEKKPDVTVTDTVYGEDTARTLLEGKDYTVTYTNNINAGNATVTVTGQGNYSGSGAATFTIDKASIADLVPTVSGTAAAGQVLTASLSGVDDSEVTYTWTVGDNTATGKTYVVQPADSSKEITVKAAGNDANYTGTTADSAPLTVAMVTVTGTVTITGTGSGDNGVIVASDTLTASVSMEPSAAATGATYQWNNNGTAIDGETAATYTVQDGDGQITVTVTPNADFAGTLTSAAIEVGKAVLSGSVSVSATGTPTVGDTLTAVVSANPATADDYTITWLRDGVETSTTGESYTVTADDLGKTITAKVTAKGDTYTGELVSGGTLIPATAPDAPMVTATAGDAQVTVTWTTPAANGAPITGYTVSDGTNTVSLANDVNTYTFTGLTNGTAYTFTVTATNSAGTSTGGTATATPTGYVPPENPDDDDVNYPVVPPVIVDPLPGNGGGGNGGGGTTTNPNEPVTNTTTDSQGNVTTTTTYPDGSETKVEEKADGTVITTEVDPEGNKSSTVVNTDGSTMTTVENVDGSSSFVSTDANGKTSAVVELPAKTVEDANTTGRPAALPMDSVTATTDSATAPVVTVNTANEQPVKVEIPVSNAGSGTVAVLVKADGTEEIIKTTIPTADGIAVTLNSGESVKVVDNSKYFSDTATHWGSDAVDFVSARELFGGTGDNKFSPDDAMTRGMLMTVLARFENVDTTGGAAWYEKGVAWAVTQGLSDGTNPNGRITREQLATIIYRYAQSKGVNTTAGGSLERFPDAGRVSDWAMEAMSWCVAEGIISGVGGMTLDPAGNATRAQVATIIMRYAEKFAA